MDKSIKADRFRKKGQKYLLRGKTNRAFTYFEKALMLSDDPSHRYNFALVLVATAKYSEAEPYLKDLYLEFPENELNALSYGDCLMMLRKWDEAEDVFFSLKEKNPVKTSYKEYYSRVKDVVEREKYVSSRELISCAINDIDNKKFSSALEKLIKAEKLDPNNPTIITNLGSLYLKQKNYIKACKYLESAQRINPTNKILNDNLQHARLKLKNQKGKE